MARIYIYIYIYVYTHTYICIICICYNNINNDEDPEERCRPGPNGTLVADSLNRTNTICYISLYHSIL